MSNNNYDEDAPIEEQTGYLLHWNEGLRPENEGEPIESVEDE